MQKHGLTCVTRNLARSTQPLGPRPATSRVPRAWPGGVAPAQRTAHSAQRTAQRMCTLPLRAAHRLVRSGDCHSYVSPRRGLKGLPSRRACVHGARSSAQSGGQGVSMCMCMCMGCA